MLRQSILNNYEVCPFACAQEFGTLTEPKKQEREETYTSKYSGTGIVFHKAMEYWGREKIKGHSITLIELHDKLDEYYKELPLDLFKDKEEYDTFYNSLHEQITWTYEKTCSITPVDIEKQFEVDSLYSDMQVGFTGTIDRIEGDMDMHDITLLDYKTGKLYTKKELASNMQAAIYAEYFNKVYGFYPKRFVFYFTKHKRVKEINITPLFLQTAKARIQNVYYKMLQGDYAPNYSNKYFCKNFCDYKKICPYFTNSTMWHNVGYEVFDPSQNV